MRKCTKSELDHKLEATAHKFTQLGEYDRQASIIIRDGMALIHALLVHQYHTFDDLAAGFLGPILEHHTESLMSMINMTMTCQQIN